MVQTLDSIGSRANVHAGERLLVVKETAEVGHC